MIYEIRIHMKIINKSTISSRPIW